MDDMAFNPNVAVCRISTGAYPSTPPFHPGRAYPEYRWGALGPSNLVYEGVRELFHLLQLDETNYGTPVWNPLGALVRPGDRVVVKPNFLWHAHKYKPDEWNQVITHGSIIRAVVDYVLIALDGRGEVWIADGPQLDADWEQIITRTGVREVSAFYAQESSVPVHLLDLRDTWIDMRGDVVYNRVSLPGDPNGSTVVNLGSQSRFVEHHGSSHYYGADYDQVETNYHHSEGRHEYRISRTIASADVFINLPKMKTHKKVGVTLCLKNLVGVNTGRNWLPHHTDGDPTSGGDQFAAPSVMNASERAGVRQLQRMALRYPKTVAPLFRVAKALATPVWGHTEKTIRNGNWHGNDTAWRMVHDINRCLLYSDGVNFPLSRPKRYFAIVDGVVAGDGNGPAAPDRFEAGILVAGFNPVAVDCATTKLMGFDPMKIAMLRQAFELNALPIAPFTYADIRVVSNQDVWNGPLDAVCLSSCFRFRPHFGWVNQIEEDAAPEFKVSQ